MNIKLLTIALVVGLTGLMSLSTSCNRHREETSDRPGSAPRVEQSPGVRLIYPPRPAGDPNVIAPPRPISPSADQGESAAIAAGHTKSEQKIDK